MAQQSHPISAEIHLSTHPGRARLPNPHENIAQICAVTVKGWRTRSFSLDQLAAHLDRGASVAPVYTDGHARNESFAETWLIALDCDEPGEYDSVRANAWIQQYTRIEGETKSSQPGAVCGRVFLILAEPLRDVAAVKNFTDRVLYRLEQDGIDLHDKGVKDAFRPYFGFKTGTTHVGVGERLTPADLDLLPVRPTAAPISRPSRPTATGDIDWDDARAEWIAREVMPHLDRVSPVIRQRGQYRQCPNPHHTDENPSFRISTQKHSEGYPVCSCNLHHEKDAWGKVAGWVGARDFKTWFREEQHKPHAAVRAQKTDESPRFHLGGVPISWRSQLLSISKSENLALLYEIVTDAARAGDIDPAGFTLKDLEAAKLKQGRSALLKSLDRLCDELAEIGVFHRIEDKRFSASLDYDFAKNALGGRPGKVYCLPDLEIQRAALLYRAALKLREKMFAVRLGEDGAPVPMATITRELIRSLLPEPDVPEDEIAAIAAEAEAERLAAYAAPAQAKARDRASAREKQILGYIESALKNTNSVPLSEEWLKAGYRVAFLRVLAEQFPERYLNKGHARIARAIGVSTTRVGEFLKRAAIDNHTRRNYVAVTAPPEHVVNEVQRIAKENHAKPLYVRAVAPDGRVIPVTLETGYSSTNAMTYADTVASTPGARLEVEFQFPNEHEVKQDALPVIRKAMRSSRRKPSTRNTPPVPVEPDDPPEELNPPHDPVWARAQIELSFVRQNDALIYPPTGELLPADSAHVYLLQAMIGRKIRRIDRLMIAIRGAGGQSRTLSSGTGTNSVYQSLP